MMNPTIRILCLLLAALLASCSSTPEVVDYHQSSLHWSGRLDQDSAYLQDNFVTDCPHLTPLLVGTWTGFGNDLAGYLQWISADGSRSDCLQKAAPGFFLQLHDEGYVWQRQDPALLSAVLEDDRTRLATLLVTVEGIRAYDHALIQQLQTDFYRQRITLEGSRKQTFVVDQHIRQLAGIQESLQQRLGLWRGVSVAADGESPLFSDRQLGGYAQKIARLENLRNEIESLYAGAFFQ